MAQSNFLTRLKINVLMKTSVFFFLLLLTASLTFGQTLSGAAATYEKNFNSSIAKLKSTDPVASKGAYESALGQAEAALKQLQKAAPDYNTSKHQSELETYKKAAQPQGSAGSPLVKMLDQDMTAVRKASASNDAYLLPNSIAKARRTIASIKKNDPSFDASKYESELNELEGASVAKEQNLERSRLESDNFERQYQNAFGNVIGRTGWVMDPEPDIAKADAKLQKMIDGMNAVANSEAGQKAKDSDDPQIKGNLIPHLEEQVGKNSIELQYLQEDIDNSYKKYKTAEAYYKLLAREQYWLANLKIFPNVAGIQQALSETQAKIRSVGSYQDALAKMQRNLQKTADAERIPAGKRNDPALEAELKRLFNQSEVGKGKTIQRISITSPDWVVKKDPITNKVVQRVMDFYIGYKDASGNCAYHFGNMFQPYQNGSYGATNFFVNDAIPMNCGNMNQ